MKKATPQNFRDAYATLQRHAQTLRDPSEPNIDDLLTIVTESVSAYQVCKERIDAVEAALQAALQGVDEGGAPDWEAPPPASAPAAKRSLRKKPSAVEDGGDWGEDEIPF